MSWLVDCLNEPEQDPRLHKQLARIQPLPAERGSLTVWMSPAILWLDSVRSGAQGRPKVCTDAAIQAILTLKVLFKLALRQALERQGGFRPCPQ